MITYAEYKKRRRSSPLSSARDVVNYIKHVRENKERWADIGMLSNGVANFCYEGYTIVVRVEPDECCDLDWDGKFTDTWSKEVVPNPEWGRASEWSRRGIFRYWLPANPWRESWKYYREVLKLGRHEAYTRAWGEAYKDAERSDSRSIYVMTVIAYKEGIELGADSLSGIEFSDDGPSDPYLYDLLNDMVPSAVDAAGAVLKKLCEV